jgi:hypothetical protein
MDLENQPFISRVRVSVMYFVHQPFDNRASVMDLYLVKLIGLQLTPL